MQRVEHEPENYWLTKVSERPLVCERSCRTTIDAAGVKRRNFVYIVGTGHTNGR